MSTEENRYKVDLVERAIIISPQEVQSKNHGRIKRYGTKSSKECEVIMVLPHIVEFALLRRTSEPSAPVEILSH